MSTLSILVKIYPFHHWSSNLQTPRQTVPSPNNSYHCRYTGETPEPRPNLSSGHIPNSLPLPFTSFLSPSTPEKPYTSYKTPSELKEVFIEAVGGEGKWKEVENGEKAVVFSCGSGMTAGVGWLASRIVAEGVKSSIYDEVRFVTSRFSSFLG